MVDIMELSLKSACVPTVNKRENNGRNQIGFWKRTGGYETWIPIHHLLKDPIISWQHIQGWESKLRRILQNVNKRRHLGTKNVCFCLSLFLLEITENQIYVLTRYTIFRFVRYMLIAQLFRKTKVIANLHLEAGQNFYENVLIRRSSYCFIYRFFLQINYIFVSEFTIYFEI
jgi:hypothetical protein